MYIIHDVLNTMANKKQIYRLIHYTNRKINCFYASLFSENRILANSNKQAGMFERFSIPLFSRPSKTILTI